jgi:hypothetical protein
MKIISFYLVGLYSFLGTVTFSTTLSPADAQRDGGLAAAAAFLHYLSNPHFPPPLRQTARCVLAFSLCCTCLLCFIFLRKYKCSQKVIQEMQKHRDNQTIGN